MFLPACTGGCGGATDTAGNDSGAADTSTDADTDADADTAVEPAGSVSVTVFYGDAGTISACGPDTDGVLAASFDDALGNVAGRVRCSSPTGELLLQFTNGHAGAWTDPDGGVSFQWTDPVGTTLTYDTAGRTEWGVTFDRFDRVDTKTIHLAGSMAGTWPEVTVAAAVDVVMPCTNWP